MNQIDNYEETPYLHKNFIDRQFVFDIFGKNWGSREYIRHICNQSDTEQMYNIIKRIKKEYLLDFMTRFNLSSRQMLSRGSFGGVYGLIDKTNIEYVIKITGQCKYIDSGGRVIPQLNSTHWNEITINKKAYNLAHNNLLGKNYVLKCFGGLLVQCENNNCIVTSYTNSRHIPKLEKKLKKSIDKYIKNTRKKFRLDILMPIIEKYDGIPLNRIFHRLSNNPMFIYGLALFIKEFLELIYYTDDSFSHNDLHPSNILIDPTNISEFISDTRYIDAKTYPFRIIDFGLAIKGTVSRDKEYILQRIFVISVI